MHAFGITDSIDPRFKKRKEKWNNFWRKTSPNENPTLWNSTCSANPLCGKKHYWSIIERWRFIQDLSFTVTPLIDFSFCFSFHCFARSWNKSAVALRQTDCMFLKQTDLFDSSMFTICMKQIVEETMFRFFLNLH